MLTHDFLSLNHLACIQLANHNLKKGICNRKIMRIPAECSMCICLFQVSTCPTHSSIKQLASHLRMLTVMVMVMVVRMILHNNGCSATRASATTFACTEDLQKQGRTTASQTVKHRSRTNYPWQDLYEAKQPLSHQVGSQRTSSSGVQQQARTMRLNSPKAKPRFIFQVAALTSVLP